MEEDMSMVVENPVGVNLSGVKAPALVAFERALEARRARYEPGAGDPFVRNECPPWCRFTVDLEPGEAAHPVEASELQRRHESHDIVVPVATVPGVEGAHTVQVGCLTVNLSASIASRSGVHPFVMVDKHGAARDGHPSRRRVVALHPVEAVELARALLVSARLADDSLDVEGVAW